MALIKKILLILVVTLMFVGCSDRSSENLDVDEPADETIEVEDNEDLNDYKNAPFKVECNTTITVRYSPSTDAFIKGYVREGDHFEVYETVESEGYIWNRIGNNAWIANDGTWITRIPYDTDILITDFDLICLKELPVKITGSFYETSGGTLYSKGDETIVFTKNSDGKISYIESHRIQEYNVYIPESNTEEIINKEKTSEIYWIFKFGFSPLNYEINGRSHRVQEEHDLNGNIIYEKYDWDNRSVIYSYDEAGHLIEMIEQYDEKETKRTTTFTYEEDGRLSNIEISSYDPLGDEYSNGVLETTELEYNGNLVFYSPQYFKPVGGGENITLRIDNFGRIAEEYRTFMGYHDWMYCYE